MLLMATTAQAQTTYLSHKGAWATFVVKADNGRLQCGMQVLGNGSSLMVKYATGDQIFLQVFKDDWRIPKGTDIPGYLAFDNSERYPFEGVGGPGPNGEGVVTLGIKPGTEDAFLSLMADANKMTIGFTEGTQPPLVANMSGSRDAVAMFRKCSTGIDAVAAAAPQPFGKPAPQPFNSAPAAKPARKDDGGI